ncbi:MAG: hypothetical protein R3F35_11725 [Myxococcota bacterium]
MKYQSPFAVAILLIAAIGTVYFVVRRLRESAQGRGVLDDAERAGLLSTDLRERWDRDRRNFLLIVVAIAALTALLIWIVNREMSPWS